MRSRTFKSMAAMPVAALALAALPAGSASALPVPDGGPVEAFHHTLCETDAAAPVAAADMYLLGTDRQVLWTGDQGVVVADAYAYDLPDGQQCDLILLSTDLDAEKFDASYAYTYDRKAEVSVDGAPESFTNNSQRSVGFGSDLLNARADVAGVPAGTKVLEVSTFARSEQGQVPDTAPAPFDEYAGADYWSYELPAEWTADVTVSARSRVEVPASDEVKTRAASNREAAVNAAEGRHTTALELAKTTKVKTNTKAVKAAKKRYPDKAHAKARAKAIAKARAKAHKVYTQSVSVADGLRAAAITEADAAYAAAVASTTKTVRVEFAKGHAESTMPSIVFDSAQAF